MGDIYVEIELENYADRVLCQRGFLTKEAIKSTKVKVLVDTGAVLLLLPEDLVNFLGLERLDKVIVTYADERKEQRDTAGAVLVKVGNRSMITHCIVGPPNCEPLLGQIIMEGLDLLVDPRGGKLVPRPESPYLPSLKLK